ncbi:dihydroxyacetone kinase subunit DhaK [Enterovibrio sp. ZSDZ42]|uniref:Dihydroxyacetone kinase subunit DhaK n=1 Tax=Enterovibrio gelatinilyticus TaxID=2899819 RepID=A0ABT5R316_9GAMM|nr:dihydroxyacetone kinase subunit DhaK [Enterovibrio sp. ZSDZ42]MDD1794399.1 dihydroxyacetone kinase subunit DhaK [Enterovibrio sp. ZSDZ42]
MSRFFAHDNQHVPLAIQGYLASNAHRPLAMLEGEQSIKVVLRTDWDKSKVAILSGGGAGHEPAHVGFVGQGMLTAAIAGDVFASPSVEAILQAIIATTGKSGCFLIVKSYTGDRLNFGLAAEKARAMGYQVDMIIVGDDIALPDVSNPRGIAGTLFVHKLAGHLSEQGKSLEEIATITKAATQGIHSIGLALSSCALPYDKTGEFKYAPEIGMGIHGEPGFETVDIANAEQAVKMMLKKLAPYTENNNKRFALLINNLGATTELELQIITQKILASPLRNQLDIVFEPGAYMTSLNMYGVSLSLIALDDTIREALLSDVAPTAWPASGVCGDVNRVPMHNLTTHTTYSSEENSTVEQLIVNVCQELVAQESYLNTLDEKVGDGDTGTTFSHAAKAILAKLENDGLPLNTPEKLFQCIGQELSTVMGGSSGVLLSIFFTAVASANASGQSINISLLEGITKVQQYGGAKLNDRTMLDAAIPALEVYSETGDIQQAANAARLGAEATARMTKARAGRSSYLREDSLIGNVDPGAMAIAKVFHVIHRYAQGEK